MNQFLSWRECTIVGALIGVPIATNYAAPEYVSFALPFSVALLIIYVWATRWR
jgi:hypothetical protein